MKKLAAVALLSLISLATSADATETINVGGYSLRVQSTTGTFSIWTHPNTNEPYLIFSGSSPFVALINIDSRSKNIVHTISVAPKGKTLFSTPYKSWKKTYSANCQNITLTEIATSVSESNFFDLSEKISWKALPISETALVPEKNTLFDLAWRLVCRKPYD